jgi:hypothetical protein
MREQRIFSRAPIACAEKIAGRGKKFRGGDCFRKSISL